jgi:hypothetical protein
MLTVITGPHCSGKSTYARQHAVPGDIVIDFDLIAQALGSPVTHGHDPQFRKVAMDARDGAITGAIALHRQGTRVWIIHGRPTAAAEAYYARQGGRLVRLSAGRDELHRRADADGRPASYHALIDEWFGGGGDPRPAGRTTW